MRLFILIFLILHATSSYSKNDVTLACPKGESWVKQYHRRAYTRYDGTPVSASNVTGHCRTQSKAEQFWSDKFNDLTPPSWPNKNEKFKPWTLTEKERLLDTLDSIPEELWSNQIKGIYRALKSKEAPNPATYADGIIVLYDSAFDTNRNLSRILSHEMAHQAYADLTPEERKDYWYSTNWFPFNESKGLFISRKDGYIQDDGRESPDEDFANNLEFHLFEPEKLQKVTPQAMGWIKKHFGDKFGLRRGVKNK